MFYPYYYFYRQCPPGTRPYTIRAGDNFYRLAQQFNTTVAAIISANPLVNPNSLQIGQQICIPRQPIFPACPEGNYYTIKAGDTLYSIARSYNISLDDLIEANPQIDPRRLFVGQVICIPLAVPPVTCPEGTTPYTVVAGDTLYAIARRFNVPYDALVEANPGIDPERLLIGQQICIPAPLPPAECPEGTEAYSIQTGDTFYAIAREYNTTVEALIQANPGVNPNNLRVGQQICIPTAPAPSECPEGTFSYTIKTGDTFYSIAQQYNTTVEALIDYNPDMDPDSLQIGQQICVPEAE